MSVKIYTANLNIARQDPDLLDVTKKSGVQAFAPAWAMVMGHKSGQVSDKEYINEYIALMRRSYDENQEVWASILNRERVVLGCYCKPGADFCHRYLLAEILERLGGQVVGELMPDGTIAPIPRMAFLH